MMGGGNRKKREKPAMVVTVKDIHKQAVSHSLCNIVIQKLVSSQITYKKKELGSSIQEVLCWDGTQCIAI